MSQYIQFMFKEREYTGVYLYTKKSEIVMMLISMWIKTKLLQNMQFYLILSVIKFLLNRVAWSQRTLTINNTKLTKTHPGNVSSRTTKPEKGILLFKWILHSIHIYLDTVTSVCIFSKEYIHHSADCRQELYSYLQTAGKNEKYT